MFIIIKGSTDGVPTDSYYNSCVDYTKSVNYNSIDMNGVNRLIINRDTNGIMHIIQASGWTWNRGLFVDMYNEESCNSFH